jgi:thiamine pyrophosphokinase
VIDTSGIAPFTLLAIDGDVPSASLVHDLAQRARAIVAADGAAVKLSRLAVVPDVVIGDLDSISSREALRSAGTLVVEEPSQEKGDLEKAIEWIVARGEESVVVVGAMGGMPDHALNNMSILARHAPNIAIRLVDDRYQGYLVTTSLAIETSGGDRVSLIPLPEARISTHGLEWELHDEVLAIGIREGASNRAIGALVRIDVSDGAVIAFHYPLVGMSRGSKL